MESGTGAVEIFIENVVGGRQQTRWNEAEHGEMKDFAIDLQRQGEGNHHDMTQDDEEILQPMVDPRDSEVIVHAWARDSLATWARVSQTEFKPDRVTPDPVT